MLKIKDNVDLQELEKFGFIKNDSMLFRFIYINKCNTIQNRIFMHEDLHLSFGNVNRKVLNTLYDLIKADLVEKVEENLNLEIIEEKKIPEKLDLQYKDIIYNPNFKENILMYCDNLQFKINEIIDCLKSEENLKGKVIEEIPQFEGTLEQLNNLCNIKSKGEEVQKNKK